MNIESSEFRAARDAFWTELFRLLANLVTSSLAPASWRDRSDVFAVTTADILPMYPFAIRGSLLELHQLGDYLVGRLGRPPGGRDKNSLFGDI